SNPQFAQIGSPSDMVIVFVYNLHIGGQEGEATLCVPFSSLQPVLDEVAANSLLAGRVEADADSVRRALAGRMGAAPVTVNVRFQPIMLTMADIVDLRPGDIVPLEHPVDEPLEVSVGGVPRFTARPGRRGKRLACVIASVAEKETA
ncbi:MAG TPA: FliM/FliN family flagellar motor switch protein, partial [Acidimicrobiia bacterium]|nr:FliM/FliN family flagellar motor switch protein [Acidimicrobiia bacterium]